MPLDVHFEDESLEAIDCTGTDNQEQRNQTYHQTYQTYTHHTWQFIIFTIFTITAYIFSYSLSISFWTQDLALQQTFSSIDLFVSYRTDYTNSRII